MRSALRAGDLAFIDGDGLNPGKNFESLAYLHRRIRLDGLTQCQSVGSDHPIGANPRSPIFVVLYPLDETQHVFVARMKCHHIIVVLQLADFSLRAGRWVPRILVVKDHALPHQCLQFRHGMQAIDHIVVGIVQIIGVIRQQVAGVVRWVGQGLRNRRTDGPELATSAEFVAKDIQQNAETSVFQFFVPRWGQSLDNQPRSQW